MATLAQLNYKIKYFTFDRSIIKRNWRNINEGPLKKAGLLVRRIARNSIRRRAYGNPSAPGTPPHSHVPGKTPPFKMIYSVPDYFGASVVIGMVGFNKPGVPAPGVQEHGLTVTRTVDTSYQKRPKKRGPKKRLTAQQIQAIRKKKIKAGVIIKQRINLKERPFMAPALKKAAPTLPAMWRNSVGGRYY